MLPPGLGILGCPDCGPACDRTVGTNRLGDIYQWEWIDPDDHALGRQQANTLSPDGAGHDAVPFADLRDLNLTMAWLHSTDLHDAIFYRSTLTDADLSQANLTHADFTDATLTGTDFTAADTRGASSLSLSAVIPETHNTIFPNGVINGLDIGQNILSR